MSDAPQWLLIGGVIVVGVLHTMVPDHWLPITLLARQQGWTRAETAWAAAQAGFGHVVSTLLLGLAVWLGGATLAERFGTAVDLAASAALVVFGGWIALSAWREQHHAAGEHHHSGHHHGHNHHRAHHHAAAHRHATAEWLADPLYLPAGGAAVLGRHIHLHRHGGGLPHVHWHDHLQGTMHEVPPEPIGDPPLHQHRHKTAARTALVLILGSSPMVEGIPAFFAASRYGVVLLSAMALAFAASTIATYVALCVGSTEGLQRLRLGRFERYGEVLSGGFIAAIGLAFGLASAM